MKVIVSVGFVLWAVAVSAVLVHASDIDTFAVDTVADETVADETVAVETVDSEEIRISEIRLGTSPEVNPDLRVFPEGTKTIFARFHYEGATGELLWLKIAGRGGIVVLQRSERYRGDGTATVQFNGADIYRTLTQTLDDAARAGQTSARSAATQQIGMLEFLMDTQYQTTRVEQALDLLAQVSLPPTQSAQIASALISVDEIAGLLKDALALPPDDVSGKQALAAKMAAPFRSTVTNSGMLVNTAGQVRDVVIPGSDVDAPGQPARNAYTLNLEVAGDIVVPSTEFWVRRTLPRTTIFLPTARQHE
jgi:hypothetical protein